MRLKPEKVKMFQKPQRNVDRVFIHCSASDNPAHDDVSVINQWHLDRGWSTIGYHYFIKKDGTLQEGRGLERTPAAQKGHNVRTIAICLHGLDIDKFTENQFDTLRELCNQIDKAYKGKVTFHGHREVNPNKTCPVFDVDEVLGLTESKHLKWS